MKRKHGSLGSFLAGAVTMLLLMGLVTGALATNAQKSATLYYSDIKVCLDGKVLKLADATGAEVEPFTISGTTYLPVRAISEALGLDVEWNGSSHTVYLTTKPGGSVDVAGERVSMGTLKAYSFSHKDDDGSANFDSTSSFTNRQTVYHPENRLYMAAGSGVLGWTKLKVPSTMSVTYLVNKEYKAFTAYAGHQHQAGRGQGGGGRRSGAGQHRSDRRGQAEDLRYHILRPDRTVGLPPGLCQRGSV